MIDPLKKKILIVENDEDIRDIVGEVLLAEGYAVQGCTYAIQNLINQDADLILLDEWVNLREGQMLCKEIKALEKLAHIPVIIFSTSSDIAEIAVACQANGYVKKPFDLDTLVDEVRKVLSLAAGPVR
jgi:DNA-binding response OmpR family regulator